MERNDLFDQSMKKIRTRYWICIALFGLGWIIFSKWAEDYPADSFLHNLIKDAGSFSIIFAIGLFARIIALTTSLQSRYKDSELRLEDILKERKEFLKGMKWMLIIWGTLLSVILLYNLVDKNSDGTNWVVSLLIVFPVFLIIAYLLRTKDDQDLKKLKANLDQALDIST